MSDLFCKTPQRRNVTVSNTPIFVPHINRSITESDAHRIRRSLIKLYALPPMLDYTTAGLFCKSALPKSARKSAKSAFQTDMGLIFLSAPFCPPAGGKVRILGWSVISSISYSIGNINSRFGAFYLQEEILEEEISMKMQ